jgi:hypothetical protein
MLQRWLILLISLLLTVPLFSQETAEEIAAEVKVVSVKKERQHVAGAGAQVMYFPLLAKNAPYKDTVRVRNPQPVLFYRFQIVKPVHAHAFTATYYRFSSHSYFSRYEHGYLYFASVKDLTYDRMELNYSCFIRSGRKNNFFLGLGAGPSVSYVQGTLSGEGCYPDSLKGVFKCRDENDRVSEYKLGFNFNVEAFWRIDLNDNLNLLVGTKGITTIVDISRLGIFAAVNF